MKIKKIILLLIALQFFYTVSNAQIKLVGNITTNGVASYPTHIDSLGRGGYMSLPTATERDAIPNLRRKYGMLVFVQADGKIYKLNAPTLTNTDWAELSFGSSGSQYTDALARSATSLTVTGSSGAATYSSTTGVFNIPNYTLAGLGGSPSSRTITINGTAQDLSADRSWSVGTVTNVNALTLGTTGTDITSSVANGTTSPTITLNIPTASATNRGALSAADFSIFNAKQSALTFSTGLTNTSNTITVNTSQNIATLSNLTSNGIVTTSGGGGTLSVTSMLPVANGGTGATTLTGVLKGNGTSALTAATAGTDYQAPITLTTSGSGAATFSGTTLNIPSYTLSGLGGVPYTGATGPVDLGNYELSVNGLMIGRGAGAIATNSRIGESALGSNTIGNNNTATGVNALKVNTAGAFNTAIGANALQSNTVSNNNTASGANTLQSNTTGNSNTANGTYALSSNTQGEENTANGVNALKSNTTASNNTANGMNALYSNTIGNYNTASGHSALITNVAGSNNTASGAFALDKNSTGDNNTASGMGALYSNSIGNDNSASGMSVLNNNTTGNNNTGNGKSALFYNTIGESNTAIGHSALITNVTGSNNTAIGYSADVASNSLYNATAIGNGASATLSNTIQLGNSSVINVKTSGTITAGTITYPNTAGTNGYYLKTDGTGTASWAAVSGGASTVGSISGSSNVNGATISGATLTLTPADASNGGIVTTGVQTFAGAKTFNNDVTGNNNPKISGFSANINPQTNTTYTLAASDNGKIITLNNSGSITLTLPVLTAGFNCMIIQSGEGVVTLTGSSTTISNKNSFTKTAGVNSVVTVIYLTANTAITIGDMTN